ncbi:MAG: hypothetical protein CMO01_04795, partial [Thalassobius sp.]|nr:hypothetical protein [Thalassovita sp.]
VIRARSTCEVRATLINGEEVENMRRPIEARDPLASFMDAMPVLDTRLGGWYEIDSDDKAMDASRISETAIGLFYKKSVAGEVLGQEAADGVRWFALLEHKGGETLAPVVMAAQPAESADLENWPQASHVSGQANADCYESRREDIEALAEQEGLLVRPNHMGREITAPSESVGMEL